MTLESRHDAHRKILVVEDDLALQPLIQRMVSKINPDSIVDWTTNAEEALELLEQDRGYDVVLSDVRLEGQKTGVDLVEECWRKNLSANIILTSGNADFHTQLPFLPK